MNFDAFKSLPHMFFEQVEQQGERPFLWAKRAGAWQPLTWRETAMAVSRLARGLEELGIEPGDRVVLVCENRPEWFIADMAILCIGAIAVPAYVTNTIEDNLHILENSEAKGAIVSTRKLADKLLPAARTAPDMQFVVAIEDPDVQQNSGVDLHMWDRVLEKGDHRHENVVDDALALKRDQTACIIYTSGTGGAPKGVMLSHGAVIHNCEGAFDALLELGLEDEVFLSFLPLSHSYEHAAGLMFPMAIGAQIYYAEGLEKLMNNIGEVKPTIMTAVPRLYESIHARMTRDVKKAGGKKEKLFNATVELGLMKHNGRGLGLVDGVKDFALERLVRKKIQDRFGGRLKALVSGGAPLNPDIGRFFQAIGLRILQGYGQTETAPVVSVNRPTLVKMETVGPPLTKTEVRIAEDGEILVRGELTMQGYWRNEEATKEVLRDGWIHTGDVGEMDADGYIKITDRKKDIIVNSGGDNISPQRIEGMLTLEHEIAQAMVFGDKRPHLVALIIPDESWALGWAKENGKPADLAVLAADPDFEKAIASAISRVNTGLSNIEKVRKSILSAEPFSIDNGQMTPTMKIRRHMIKAAYGAKLEALYG